VCVNQPKKTNVPQILSFFPGSSYDTVVLMLQNIW